MNSIRRTFTQSLLTSLGSVGVVGVSGCMSPPKKSPELIQDQGRIAGLASRANEPRLMVGQAWEFQAVNMFNGVSLGTVLHRVEPSSGQAVNLSLADERGIRREVFTERWKLSQEAHHDATLRFESPVALIPSQLSLGFQERYYTRYVVVPENPTGASDLAFRSLFWQVYLDVQGWETMQVPAGRFDVARIQRRIFFKHFDGFRTESSRLETIWYSPQLGYWVAREWTGKYLSPGGRRRGAYMREDWVRWELQRVLGAPTA
jgi:hypothetical protein